MGPGGSVLTGKAMINLSAAGTIAAHPAPRGPAFDKPVPYEPAPYENALAYHEQRQASPLVRLLTFGNGPLRNVLFLLAVLALNYTISRPSPVDFLFLCVLLLAPAFAGLWTWLGRRHRDPSQPLKISLGLLFLGLGYVFMVWAGLAARDGAKASMASRAGSRRTASRPCACPPRYPAPAPTAARARPPVRSRGLPQQSAR